MVPCRTGRISPKGRQPRHPLVVALTYGRPGQYIAFSENSSGAQWRDHIAVVPEQSLFGVNDLSSAMAGITATGDDELLLVYDVRNYCSQEMPGPATTISRCESG